MHLIVEIFDRKAVESTKIKMNEIASRLPEYPIVMETSGVGTALGPQLMAEIGNIKEFTHKGALIAYAGVDPGVNQSGKYKQISTITSKRGSAELRRILYLVVEGILKRKPVNDPVYQF